MFVVNGTWLLKRACSAWATVIFGLTLFMPNWSLYISRHSIRMSWVKALADSQSNRTNESILTLKLAIEIALAGNPGL